MMRALFICLCCTVLFWNCRTTKKGLEQVKSISRWKGCIAIDLPVITLTPERTQAERQLIGTETELEPDGWLISTPVSVNREKDPSAPGARESSILLYYEGTVQKFKDLQLIGETRSGELGLVPAELTLHRPDPRTLQQAQEIANRVNQTRSRLAAQSIQANYRREVKPGQWLQNDQGQWHIKR